MEKITERVEKKERAVKVVQFGEGNFLRGFVDYMLDVANEKGAFDGSVAVVKPISYGSLENFHAQNGLYTLLLRGRQEGETVVIQRAVSVIDRAVDAIEEYEAFMELAHIPTVRFVVSNTTEAGIVYDETDAFSLNPPKTYPGKLCKFLFERYTAFNGAADKGLILLPCELIENNGGKLRECVLKLCALWKLPEGFKAWLEESNLFCSTLVDRIVTGYPKEEASALEEELGYHDALLDTGEPFALWVIESDRPEQVEKELPLPQAGLPVIYTQDQAPYRVRKVRILNGAHTSTVLGAYLAGFDYVGDCMADPTVRSFMERVVYEEIAPTVPLPAGEVKAFAASVFERFENPFIKHALLSIALNSVSKWKSRILPSYLDSVRMNGGKLPERLTFSFAALAAFYTSGSYQNGELTGLRGAESYPILDDADVLAFFGERLGETEEQLIRELAGHSAFWGRDLSEIEGFCNKAAGYLRDIRRDAAQALRRVLA
ncbi:MAG: tagaturonate reductase [Provencibacterium sp.]|nr:tagaturonate reductase [Provencibacterium sp.]